MKSTEYANEEVMGGGGSRGTEGKAICEGWDQMRGNGVSE